jgi:4-amino-4-deoxy-L-arabinose transferase-like glycosyltransferase
MIRNLRLITTAIAGLYILLWLVLAIMRAGYPFELEWMEGAMVLNVARILDGQALYVAPTFEFIPFLYAPLYYYISAFVAMVIGEGFLALRLVAIMSTLGCLFLIFEIVRRETGRAAPGLIAAGFFAATYSLGGAWFDLARVDMLFILLTLSSVLLIRHGKFRWMPLMVTIIMTLAYFTKQTTLIVALPLYIAWFLTSRRPALFSFAAFVILTFSGYWALNIIHGGWYGYYTQELPSQHAIVWLAPIHYVINNILKAIPVVAALALYYIYVLFRTERREALQFYLAGAVGFVAASVAQLMHTGSWNNALIPGYAFLAILLGLGLSWIDTAQEEKRLGRGLTTGIYLAVIIQLIVLYYDPAKQLPTDSDQAAGEQLISEIRAVEGDVYLPFHGYYAEMAGKRSFAHAMAMIDVFRADNELGKQSLSKSLEQSLAEGRIRTLILDAPTPYVHGWGETEIQNYFNGGKSVLESPDHFFPVTGMRTRPETIHEWRGD